MCEPVTIALTVAALAGGASAYQQSASAKAQAEYQSDVARNNATMAEYARQDALQRGGEEAIKAQQQAQRLRGAQVARLAGNGLDISSGTPLAILEDTDYFGQQDAQMIRNNAARQAWGYQVEGQNFSSSADMFSATAAAQKPAQAAGLSLLSSAGQFAAAGGFKGGMKAGTSTSTGIAKNTTGGLNYGNFA